MSRSIATTIVRLVERRGQATSAIPAIKRSILSQLRSGFQRLLIANELRARAATRLPARTFHPRDDTPGCTTEACAFRDAEADYQAAGAKVLGVSPDDVKSHGKFAAKFKLPFPILADTETEVCRLFDVWKEKSMYGKKYMGVERTTFLIDAQGVIR